MDLKKIFNPNTAQGVAAIAAAVVALFFFAYSTGMLPHILYGSKAAQAAQKANHAANKAKDKGSK